MGSTTPKASVTSGDRVKRPTDPYCKGASFIGWFNGNLAYDFTQPVTGDLTLTARWVKGPDSWSLTPSHGPTSGNTPATLTAPAIGDIRISQFSAGKDFSLALDSTGAIYSWGDNSKGQLGRTPSATAPANQPERIEVPDDVRFLQVSAGDDYAIAIDINHRLYSWGNNEKGQLGYGNLKSSSKPKLVWATINGVSIGSSEGTGVKEFVQVSAGLSHALALRSDGTVYSWGDDKSGQLGRETSDGYDSKYDPLRPSSLPLLKGIKITQVSAGGKASLAVASDGSIYSWGDNSSGQLSRETVGESDWKPAKADTPAGAAFAQVSVGYRHALAIDSDGNTYSWGYGSTGKPSKVALPGGIKARQVSAGHDYSLATGSDGNIYSWGDNSSGQLGRDTGGASTNQPGKANTCDGVAYAQAVAGYRHILVMGSDGYLYGWGDDSSGQLGTGTASSAPVTTPGKAKFTQEFKFNGAKLDGTPITGLTKKQDGVWSFRTPAHKKGQVDVTVTWTRNDHQADAHLAYKYDGSKYTVTFEGAGGTSTPEAQQVLDGDQAVRPDKDPAKDGYLFDGWFLKDSKGGSNIAYDFNQPVTGDIALVAHFSPVPHWSIDKKEGPETGGQSVKLTPPQGTRGIRFAWIQSGNDYSLALGSDGNLYSWGSNKNYRLGHKTSNEPARVDTPAGVRYTQAAAGDSFAIALGSDGNVYTWGSNDSGQLGRYTPTNGTDDGFAPHTAAQPAGIRYTRVYAGKSFAMALASDGNLYAWGDDTNGELGQGKTVTKSTEPLKVAAPQGITFTNIATGPGSQTVYAWGSDSNLYAWGSNNYQQLDPAPDVAMPHYDPLPKKFYYYYDPMPNQGPGYMTAGITLTQISTGDGFGLGLGSDNNLYAWGNGFKNQMGNGMWLCPPKKVDMPSGVTVTRFVAGYDFSLAVGSDGNLYSWGNNVWGQLGRTTSEASDITPTKIDAPAGISLIQPQAGANHSSAIGSDGNLYSWGKNDLTQLGRDSNGKPDQHPGKITLFPGGVGIPKLVQFGTAEGTSLTKNNDGTWTVTTPPYSPGPVTVTIDWELNGVAQTPDTSNIYRYTSISVLPRAGGTGILLLLAIGLIIIATTIAARRLRQARSLNQ